MGFHLVCAAVVEDAFALFENIDLSTLSPFFGAGQEYEGHYAYMPISEDPFSGDFRDPSNMNPSSWFGTPFLTDCSTTTSPGIHPPIPPRSNADPFHTIPPSFDRAPVDIAASYQVAGGVIGAGAIWPGSAALTGGCAPLKTKAKFTRKLTVDAQHGYQGEALYQDSSAATASAREALVESHDPADLCVRCLQGQRHSSNSLRRVTTNLGERVQGNLPFLMSILSSSDLRERLTEVGHDDEAIAKWLKAIHQKPGKYADRLPYITIGALIHKVGLQSAVLASPFVMRC